MSANRGSVVASSTWKTPSVLIVRRQKVSSEEQTSGSMPWVIGTWYWSPRLIVMPAASLPQISATRVTSSASSGSSGRDRMLSTPSISSPRDSAPDDNAETPCLTRRPIRYPSDLQALANLEPNR